MRVTLVVALAAIFACVSAEQSTSDLLATQGEVNVLPLEPANDAALLPPSAMRTVPAQADAARERPALGSTGSQRRSQQRNTGNAMVPEACSASAGDIETDTGCV